MHALNCPLLSWRNGVCLAVAVLLGLNPGGAEAGKLTVEIANGQKVTFVGAVCRWEQDGRARQKVDPKAKIDAPRVDARAVKDSAVKESAANDSTTRWTFPDLAAGKYDLVILAQGRVRIEGWYYPPLLDFGSPLHGDAAVDEEARKAISEDIQGSKYYENKVTVLAMGGSEGEKGVKEVRVLMMLLRDKPTTYKAVKDAATLRHEIWQYTSHYDSWQKEGHGQVLDRILLPGQEVRQWTWLWDAKLGGIEVKDSDTTLRYEMPALPTEKKLKGLYPY